MDPLGAKGSPVRTVFNLVGATGFEPATFCSRSKRATRLRYAPDVFVIKTLAILTPAGRASNSKQPGRIAQRMADVGFIKYK